MRTARRLRSSDDETGWALTPHSNIEFADIRTLGALYRSGEVSPVEVTAGCLDRIRRTEPRLNAWITVLEEQAMAHAGEAEQALRRGEDRGPLHGVPLAVKDNFDMAGVATTCGSPILRGTTAAEDAVAVRSLREAGAIILGKTNLLEFAYGIVHSDFGQCNNPWNLERTSGGSSSGSAASVAAGMAYGSLGTDTGGSIRIPASYCGVVGLKPTYERISRDGVFPLSWSLDHVGPIARTVGDAAALLAALDGVRAGAARPALPKARLAGRRIGIAIEHLGDDLRPGVRSAFERAVDAVRRARAEIREISVPSLLYADPALLAVIAPEATSIHDEWLRSRPGDYAEMTRAQLELGALVPALDYVRGQRFRRKLMFEFAEAFKEVDVIISPTVAWVAPAVDPVVAGQQGSIEARRSGPYNLTGLPAVTIPCGTAEDGLPAGLQIAGPWMSDFHVLSVAAAIEARIGWVPRCPPAIAELLTSAAPR